MIDIKTGILDKLKNIPTLNEIAGGVGEHMTKFMAKIEYTVMYLQCYRETPRGRSSSVHYSDKRFVKAKEQANQNPVEIDIVIQYVNEFLHLLQIDKVECPKVALGYPKIDYEKIKRDNSLKDKRDIVWIKFTKDKYVGVVATSSDVNFLMPNSKEEYHEKEKGRWKYNSSGIIVHYLDKKWDESFVLIFPLRNIPDNFNRGDVERGVGNYLISKGVPILDFFSHNY